MKAVTVRFDDEVVNVMEVVARAEAITVSDLVRRAIHLALAEWAADSTLLEKARERARQDLEILSTVVSSDGDNRDGTGDLNQDPAPPRP